MADVFSVNTTEHGNNGLCRGDINHLQPFYLCTQKVSVIGISMKGGERLMIKKTATANS